MPTVTLTAETQPERQPPAVPSPRLLDALPIGPHGLAELPEPELRRLFEAFRLEIPYDRHIGVARCRVTLTAETQPAVLRATGTGVVNPPNPGLDIRCTDPRVGWAGYQGWWRDIPRIFCSAAPA